MSNQPGLPRTVRHDWAERAACAGEDTDLWFVDQHDGPYTEARRICKRCPVRRECLAYAVETGADSGMWGGLAPRERKHLRRVGVR